MKAEQLKACRDAFQEWLRSEGVTVQLDCDEKYDVYTNPGTIQLRYSGFKAAWSKRSTELEQEIHELDESATNRQLEIYRLQKLLESRPAVQVDGDVLDNLRRKADYFETLSKGAMVETSEYRERLCRALGWKVKKVYPSDHEIICAVEQALSQIQQQEKS